MPTPESWLRLYCPSFDGQFLFLDPLSWQTHLLTEGAMMVLKEAAEAIEQDCFDTFLADVEIAGGWTPGLEFLVRSLTTLRESASNLPI